VTVSRRRLLAGLSGALLAACRGPAPKPRPVKGTQRVVEQRGEWWLPPDAAPGRLPTVVLVHGGYWGPGYDRHLEDAVAADLAGRGYLCWNVDYRAADAPWPSTLQDVAAAYDALATGRFADRVDPARLSVVGHSAGGHLALWLAARKAPFARRGPAPVTVVAQAPVAALAAGQPQGLGGGAIDRLLGGTPQQVPDRYAQADPVALLPSGVRTVLLHSEQDALVPISQSETYRAAAVAAGDDCVLERVPGDHFAHLDPKSEACARMRAALA
jgi:acetyl esterase/lipase